MCQSFVMFRMMFWSCFTLVIAMWSVSFMLVGPVSGYRPPGRIDMMVSNHSTGHLYTAGEDGLVHLDSDLNLIANMSLKPEESVRCLNDTNELLNITAMALDPVLPRLLVCSGFCDGLCAVYNSSNITQRHWLNQSINGSHIRTKSVLVFLQGGDVVVGSSRYNETEYPILSRRQLLPSGQFFPDKMIYRNDSFGNVSVVKPKTGTVYKLRFISGFESDNFSYFLEVDDSTDDKASSRLICIPSNSNSVVPFLSISLSCGQNEIASSMIVNGSDIWISFGQGTLPSDLTPERGNGSTLCQFSLSDIISEINTTTRLCFNLNFSKLIDVNTSFQPCWIDETVNQSLHLEQPRNPQKLKLPIAQYENSSMMTLVRAKYDGVVDVVFDDGSLYQVSENNGTFSLEEKKTGNAAYLIGHKLISPCNIQTTCEQCMDAHSTLKTCVWCGGKCKTRRTCTSGHCAFDNFHPYYGPISGGTILTFTGCNLNKSEADIEIWCIQKCYKSSSNLTSMQCKTSEYMDPSKNGQECKKGKGVRPSSCSSPIGNFSYEEDPKINSIEPNTTIKSGGMVLTIRGENFNVIQKPQMGMNISGILTENMTCTPYNDGTVMYCTTPEVKQTFDWPQQANLFFVMDGVPMKKLNPNKSVFDIKVHDEPYVDINATTQNSLTTGQNFTIRGSFKGVNKNDVSVRFGASNCSDVETNATTISCKPDWPKLLSEGSAEHNVTVKIGKKLQYGPIVVTVYVKRDNGNSWIIWGLYFTSVLAIALIITVITCITFKVKKKRPLHAKLQSNETASTVFDGKSIHAYFLLQPFYHQKLSEETIRRIEDSRLLVEASKLRLGAPIGAGNFGCVYIGQLYPESLDDEPQKVAVKTMHDSNQSMDLLNFVEEALIMKEFNHKNVLQLLGISISENQQPMVILPFMSNGDLLSYVCDEKNDVQISDMLRWGIDISKGMDYLSGLKLVHRDLAARNCMLDDNLCAKVADFGLCRDIYEKGYYTSDNKKKLPIRWMAPESMDRGNYSSKSDVWSLGVVLWELLTRGATPYPGVEGWDISRFLHHGRRLQQPWFCSGELYDLMLEMWSLDPSLRPTFSETAEELGTLLNNCSDQEVTSAGNDGRYVKFPDCCRYVELPVPQYFVLNPEPSRKPLDDEIITEELP